MKRNIKSAWWAAPALTLLVLAAPLGSAVAQDLDEFAAEGAMATAAPAKISPEDVKALIEKGDKSFVLVDNAPEQAYEEEHIVGAINYPWVANIKPPVQLPRNKTLILYCPCAGDDADSLDMAKKLRQFGYMNVKVLEGGWFKWLELGFPIVEKESSEG